MSNQYLVLFTASSKNSSLSPIIAPITVLYRTFYPIDKADGQSEVVSPFFLTADPFWKVGYRKFFIACLYGSSTDTSKSAAISRHRSRIPVLPVEYSM